MAFPGQKDKKSTKNELLIPRYILQQQPFLLLNQLPDNSQITQVGRTPQLLPQTRTTMNFTRSFPTDSQTEQM